MVQPAIPASLPDGVVVQHRLAEAGGVGGVVRLGLEHRLVDDEDGIAEREEAGVLVHRLVEARRLDAVRAQFGQVRLDQRAFPAPAIGEVERAAEVIGYFQDPRRGAGDAVEEAGFAVDVDVLVADVGVAVVGAEGQAPGQHRHPVERVEHPLSVVEAVGGRRAARRADIVVPAFRLEIGMEVEVPVGRHVGQPAPLAAGADFVAAPGLGMEPGQRAHALFGVFEAVGHQRRAERHAARHQIFHDDDALLRVLVPGGEIGLGHPEAELGHQRRIGQRLVHVHRPHLAAVRLEPALEDHGFAGSAHRCGCSSRSSLRRILVQVVLMKSTISKFFTRTPGA